VKRLCVLLVMAALALRPAYSRGHLYVTSYTEGFSHFVTSMTAPVASGWSGRRVGLAPTGKRRLGRRTRQADVADRGVDVALGLHCESATIKRSDPGDRLFV